MAFFESWLLFGLIYREKHMPLLSNDTIASSDTKQLLWRST